MSAEKEIKVKRIPTVEEVNTFFRENDRLAAHFDVSILELNEKYAVASMPLEEKHKNGHRTAHGGAVFVLADIAFGAACSGLGLACVTAQTSFSYINTGLVGPLQARVNLIKSGKKLIIYEVQVHDGNDILMAQGIITGYVIGTLDDLVERAKQK